MWWVAINILAVLGLSSAISPNGSEVVAAALVFDIPVMIDVSLIWFVIPATAIMLVMLAIRYQRGSKQQS